MGYSLTQNYDDAVKLEVDMNAKDDVGSGLNSQRDQIQTIDMQGAEVLASEENTPGHITDMTDTRHMLTAKGLQEELSDQVRQGQVSKKESRQVDARRQEIMKRGSIPEFVPISDSFELY